MKQIAILSLKLIILFGCSCQTYAQQYRLDIDDEIVKMMQKTKLNLPLFELAFVLPEFSYTIENDTTGLFDRRIKNSFSAKLSPEVRYIHSLELRFLLSRFKEDSLIKKEEFPKAMEKLLSIDSLVQVRPNKDFSKIYREYIQYPEQVDNVTIITLLAAENCSYYESISSDKLAMYNFNNWLQHGFNEFRYYPDSKDPIKKRINDRIVSWIIQNKKCTDNPLIIRAKEMMKETVNSY